MQTWWGFEAVLTGTMFGLFLLAALSRRADNFSAAPAVTIGSLVVLWVAFSPYFAEEWSLLKSTFHQFYGGHHGNADNLPGGSDPQRRQSSERDVNTSRHRSSRRFPKTNGCDVEHEYRKHYGPRHAGI